MTEGLKSLVESIKAEVGGDVIDAAVRGIGEARPGRGRFGDRFALACRAAAVAARAGREAGRRFDTGNWVQAELELGFA